MEKYLLLFIFSHCFQLAFTQMAKQLQMRQQVIPAPIHVYYHSDSHDSTINNEERMGTYDAQCLNAVYCDTTRDQIFGTYIEHTVFPQNQVRPLRFFMDQHNIGTMACTDAKMKVKITNSSSVIVYEDSTAGNLLLFTDIYDSLEWAGLSAIDNYQVQYMADHDSVIYDPSPANNYDTLLLGVTDVANAIFARDQNEFTLNGIWNGPNAPYIIGTVYSMTNDLIINALEVAFAQNSQQYAEVNVIIYEIDPNGTSITDVFVPIVDEGLLGNELTLTPSQISDSTLIWVPLPLSSPLLLQAGKSYLAAVQYFGGFQSAMIMSAGEVIEGGITNWFYDGTDATWYYMTEIPMIRMSVNYDVVDENRNEIKFSIYPNPSTEFSKVIFSSEHSGEISLFFQDLSGKTILQKNYGTFATGENTITIDVSGLNSGIYFCTLQAENGSSTQKLIIEK